MDEYLKRIEVAQNHLDWAVGPDEVEVAIYEMIAAEKALELYIKGEKNNGL